MSLASLTVVWMFPRWCCSTPRLIPPVGLGPPERPGGLVEAQRAPERPPEPHIAERPAALQANALEPNRDGLIGVVRHEQVRLFAVAGDGAGQGLRARAGLGIEFSEVGDRLLNNLAADTTKTSDWKRFSREMRNARTE